LPTAYVEVLRKFIVNMYKKTSDPIDTGYKNRGDLDFIMDFVRNMYNEYKHRKTRLIKKSAFIFYNITSKHPFSDGNKRTAIITCNSFLEYNGYSIGTLPYLESHKFITDVAKGKKSEKDCQRFIRKHICTLKFSKEFEKNLIKIHKNIINKL